MNATINAEIASDIEQKESATARKPGFKLKASLAPMTALEITEFEPMNFTEELVAKIAQAPAFFENLPVVIGLEGYTSDSLDFETLLSICNDHSVRAIGVRGASLELQESAKKHGLSVLSKQKDKASPIEETKNEKPAEVNQPAVSTQPQVSKVVHHPIRSGQQVYAADGDLIILASVSAGAEILADGNIHVYGTLRGRALAGVKGNTKARIFCQSMAAELVSIAGQYKISEDIPSSVIGKPCQAYLEEDALKFKQLEF